MALLTRSIGRRVVFAVIAAFVAVAPAEAQQVSAGALKAAFLANFAKFAQWPEDALVEGQPFVFCVVGDPAVAEALQQTVKVHPGPTFTVLALKPGAPLRGCHLLYIAGSDVRAAAPALEAVRGAAVFTVGEADHFAESGGIAQLVQDHGRMRFAINPAAAQRARLVLSAQLLNLAIVVKDVPYASR